MRRTARALIAVTMLAGFVLAACNDDDSGSGGGGSGGGDLNFGVFMAFTGPTDYEGIQAMNGCLPAAKLINDAGGVLGSDVNCVEYDTHGTPTDAVPEARRMIATDSNLVGVVGPSSAEAASTVPIISEAELPMFSVAGDASFDENDNPFFYRLVPSDAVSARAMALYADDNGYENIALVFASGASAQANIPPLEAAAAALDINIVENMTIEPEQPSYQTEVARLANAGLDAIIWEADATTAGTLFSELNNAGVTDVPLLTTFVASFGDIQESLVAAFTSEQLAEVLEPVFRYSATEGEGFEIYDEAIESLDGQDGVDYAQYGGDHYTRAHYDGVTIMALAMLAAESTVGSEYNSSIREILEPGDGKVVVHSFAQGKEAIEAGDDIQYVGANGEIVLNEYNNITGTYGYYEWDPATESLAVVGVLDEERLAALRIG